MNTYLETDVLIIGGGGAGLRAAIAAKKEGVDVTLVYKKGGNSTIISAGGHGAVLNLPGNLDSVEKYYEDTISSGCNINSPSLVRT